jgi:hypothetical protein
LQQIDGIDPRVNKKGAPYVSESRNYASIKELKAIQNGIEADILKAPKRPSNSPRTQNEVVALKSLSKQIDNYIEGTFTVDMIKKNPASKAAWAEEAKTLKRFNETWNDDKMLRHLLDMEPDAEAIHQYILGVNAASSKKNAVSTVKRLKEVLGSNSREINSLRSSFVYSATEPLLKTPPDLAKFVDNVDTILRDHAALYRELGVGVTDLRKLRNFAATAEGTKLSAAGNFINHNFVIRTLSRLTLGHAIAKAGVRVELGKTLLSKMTGLGKLDQKQMLAVAAGVSFDTPLLYRGGPGSGEIAAAAAKGQLLEVAKEVSKDIDNAKVERQKR